MTLKFLAAAAFLSSIFLSSCQKEHEHLGITKQVDVQLKVNETYTYTIDAASIPVITKQAAHYATSNLKLNPATRALLLTYVPEEDYLGTDEIAVTAAEAKSHDGGSCTNKADTSYTFKISISK